MTILPGADCQDLTREGRGLNPAVVLACSCVVAVLAASPVWALDQRPMLYPMDSRQWTLAPPTEWVGDARGTLVFARYEGMSKGTMTLNEAVAASTEARFSSGTIDFDIKPLGYSDTGIIFRRQENDSGEFVYLRANPDCPAANDCIQYAPITHGRMQWDIYSNYQSSAPIVPAGWNHLHLLVAGKTMLVYVNHAAQPSLVVPRLQGLSTDGGIAFKGPAVYANLVIRTDVPPAPAAARQDAPAPGTILRWFAAPPTARATDRTVHAADMPARSAWRPIAAEPTGLVNLTRAFGAGVSPAISIGWLKTTVDAVAPVKRTLLLGWARQATVFLNGKPVFTGENPYFPSERRLSPDGRLEADNASIPLDFRRGSNEIMLAIGNDWRTQAGISKASPYGWAAEAHFEGLAGIRLR